MVLSEVSLAGGTFDLAYWSKGEGEPLLFLHGIQGHPGDAPFLLQLAESRKVVAPVHLGYGSSTPIDRVDDILDVVFAYRTLLEEKGIGPVDVIGHSLGGMFAAEFAAFCPHLVRRLVLVDAYGLWLDDQPLPDPFVLADDDFLAGLFVDPKAKEAEEANARLWEGLEGDDLAVMKSRHMAAAAKFLWPIPDRGLRKRLRYVKAPTLLVWGERDEFVPLAYGREFARELPNARLEIIKGAAHSPLIEKPVEFVSTVRAFLT